MAINFSGVETNPVCPHRAPDEPQTIENTHFTPRPRPQNGLFGPGKRGSGGRKTAIVGDPRGYDLREAGRWIAAISAGRGI